MVEAFFGFKKTPFGDSPDAKQLFPSQAWTQAKARLQFLADHRGAGLLTGEVGSGKSTAARTFTTALNPNSRHQRSACCSLWRDVLRCLNVGPKYRTLSAGGEAGRYACCLTRQRLDFEMI